MIAQTSYPSQPVIFTGKGEFFKRVRTRVDARFAGRNRRGDARIYRKAAFIAVWFAGSYVLALTSKSAWAQIAFCLSYAFGACALGFNVFHDATHGSLSPSASTNDFLSWLAATALGAGRHFWRYKHNVLHHSYTNIFKWDDDVESRGYLRLSPRQPWKPRYRYQHVFFWFLYGLNTIEWFFVKDFVQYFTGRINPYQPIPPMSAKQKLEFWTSKLIYYAVFVGAPFLFLPPQRVLVGLLIFHVTLSVSLTFIFQMAHLIDKADFPVPAGSATIDEEWAAHQMRTTVNFAPGNRMLSWFCGGLNFQIEHHLFPHISHTHYPDIAPIVRRTAVEFGLPYNSNDSYIETVKSHYRILRDLSVPEPGTL
jgi:linoleoyl-CoA desaturase